MSFGSGDFVKLFDDFGDTDAFDLVPAVRSTTGTCVDEANCDYEKITLCAFEGISTKKQVDFLVRLRCARHACRAHPRPTIRWGTHRALFG